MVRTEGLTSPLHGLLWVLTAPSYACTLITVIQTSHSRLKDVDRAGQLEIGVLKGYCYRGDIVISPL